MNKINSKILFIILLFTLSLTSVSEVLAADFWPNPLDPFPGGQGNANGYISNGEMSCDIFCSSINAICLGWYDASEGEGSNIVDICSPDNRGGNNNDTVDGDVRSVDVTIVHPTLEEFNELYYKNKNQPVDVDVTIKWRTLKLKGEDFKECEASDDGVGIWQGRKKPTWGIQRLGKMRLGPDNVFRLVCAYDVVVNQPHVDDTDPTHVYPPVIEERKVTGGVSIGESEISIIAGTDSSASIIDDPFIDDNIDVGAFSMVAEKALDLVNYVDREILYPLGPLGGTEIELAGKLAFFALKDFAVTVGSAKAAIGYIPEIKASFCGFGSNVKNLMTGYSSSCSLSKDIVAMSKFEKETVAIYNNLAIQKYLTEKYTAKMGKEFAMDDGKIFRGGKSIVHVVKKAISNLWHSHPNSRIVPSGPVTMEETKGFQKLLLDAQLRLVASGRDISTLGNNVWYGGIKSIGASKGAELGDIFDMMANNQKEFAISTVSTAGKYVRRIWKTPNIDQVIDAIKNPVEVMVNGIKYNGKMMDVLYGGSGWQSYLISNSVK